MLIAVTLEKLDDGLGLVRNGRRVACGVLLQFAEPEPHLNDDLGGAQADLVVRAAAGEAAKNHNRFGLRVHGVPHLGIFHGLVPAVGVASRPRAHGVRGPAEPFADGLPPIPAGA